MPVNKNTIAKNTMMLYIRMIVVMVTTLFTTRIVLKNLGVEDYGIYNVVAGIVSMFSFLNSSMAGATQRFLSFELGINDEKRVNMVFCQSVVIHFLVASIILLLSETIGLWFVYNKLTIPEDRFDAAIWVYQIAILSFVFQVINVPYHASIIAHERMRVYAWISLIDVAIKLGIAYFIALSPVDKLVFYAILLLTASIIMFLFYRIYSKHSFKECRFHFIIDRDKFREMFSFAGWNIIGNMSFALRNQGSNILLNMFFGPAVNAARGIAHQVDSAVEQFVTNFQTASNPQIIKSYALKEYDETGRLVCQCSKFSFFLMIILGFPIFFQVEYILSIWLTKVPEYTAVFVRIILFCGFIDSLSKALITYIKATGNVKWYQIIQGGFYILALPVIYLFLKLGYSPISSLYVLLAFTVVGTFLRLFLLHTVVDNFTVKQYLSSVLAPSTLVGGVAFVCCTFVSRAHPTDSLIWLVINSTIMIGLSTIIIWSLGMSVGERRYIKSMLVSFLHKR